MKKRPSIVLGIADNHDAGAALVADGRVVAAVSEERLNRIKHYGAFPALAVAEVLNLSGVSPGDLDQVVVGTAYTPAAVLRAARQWHRKIKSGASQFSYLLHLYILYQVALRKFGLSWAEKIASWPLLKRELARVGLRKPIRFLDHHLAHAAAAGLSAPFDPALVVTIDAMGDGTSVAVHVARGGRFEPVYRQSGLSSINTYYSRVTEYLGFKPLRHEGKITGLAAYASPPAALVAHCARALRFDGPGFSLHNYLRPDRADDPFFQELGRYTRDEIAAAVQRNLETQVSAFVSYWVHRTGVPHVALAGGLFANVKLNQRIHELPSVRGVFVYPHMSDGGLAAGGAMLAAGLTPRAMPTAYLGPDITESDARNALEQAGLPFTRPADLETRVARLLADGKVVARAAGRLEWGPRALGNRSILYRPDDPSVNDWLNKRLRRTEFMPFAPATMEQDASRCYLGLAGAEETARFMTICFQCTDWMSRHCPGVVHVDGTARPQLVRPADNLPFHRILEAYKQVTGVGTVVNTSFNMHEEPIVATAEDAVRGYLDAQLDALVLGPFLSIR